MHARASAEFEARFDEGVAPAAPTAIPLEGGGREAKVEQG